MGQAAYVYRGGVTYVQVKRLTGRQAALAPAMVPAPGKAAAAGPAPAPTWPGGVSQCPPDWILPDASEVLDEAFGAWRE